MDYLPRMPLPLMKSIRKTEMEVPKQDYKYPLLEHDIALPNDTSPGIDRLDSLPAYMGI